MTANPRTTRISRSEIGSRRRGIAGVWLVLSIPLFVVVLGLVLNVGFLWLAQAELENAASSGALAGAKVLTGDHKHDDDHHDHGKHKGPHGNHGHHNHASRTEVINAAKQFVAANFLHGRALVFTDDHGHHKKHGKRACRISVVVGTVKNGVFYPGDDGPGHSNGHQHGHHHGHQGHGKHEHHEHDDACFVKLSCPVEGPLGWLCGPKLIHVTAVAVIGEHGTPRLVEIHRVHRDH